MYAGTYQVECLTIWFNFMFFHVFDKAAVGIPRKGNRSDISNMQITDTAKVSPCKSNKQGKPTTANTRDCLKIRT